MFCAMLAMQTGGLSTDPQESYKKAVLIDSWDLPTTCFQVHTNTPCQWNGVETIKITLQRPDLPAQHAHMLVLGTGAWQRHSQYTEQSPLALSPFPTR